MLRRVALVILASLLPVTTMPAAAQQPPKERGLLITPVRDYVEIGAGENRDRAFTVANLTQQPMDISFSVEAFSVTDYAYDYKFVPPKNEWVKPKLSGVRLKPGTSKRIEYDIAVPSDAPPGGQYYTIFATTTQQNGGVKSQTRAALLLYLTIAGDLVRTGTVQNARFPRITMGRDIPFSFDIKSTGNVHYFAHLEASLSGPFTKHSISSPDHLLMPGTTRNLGGSIKAPVLPGIYRANYGFKSDTGESVQKSTLFINLPPWSIVTAGLLGWVFVKLLLRRKRRRKSKAAEENQE